MVFSSYKFIFLFLLPVLLIYSLLKKTKRASLVKIFLVLSSVVFYSWGQVRFLPVFLITMTVGYFLAAGISKSSKKPLRIFMLVLGIAEGLGVLFYYKYLNFTLYSFNRFLGTDFVLSQVILPLGISFYTFQIITYLVDVYRKEAPLCRFENYLLYITFFPQLVVGPIVRHRDFLPQLTDENILKTDEVSVSRGIVLFSVGCAKKILIANPLIDFAYTYYTTDSNSPLLAWGATIAFTFAYYFDFSGYSDMAVGLGNFFNIKLPFNFNSPYKSRNMADFWRRWNISVSTFFDDYVFRSVFRFGDGKVRLVAATFITFFLSGIWHGAGWNYILWGIANGILVAIVHLATLYRIKLPSFLSYFLTGACVLLTRVLFDSSSFTEIKKTYSLMFSFEWGSFSSFWQSLTLFVGENLEVCIIMLLSAIICFFFKNTKQISENYTPSYKWALLSAFLLCLSLANMTEVSRFLYFNF